MNGLPVENETDDAAVSTETKPAPDIDGFDSLQLLGTGGMSTVYRARQILMGRTVALKLLHRHLLHESTHLARFRQEARLATMLEHPNICRVLAFGVNSDEQPYLVMEYLEGVALRQ